MNNKVVFQFVEVMSEGGAETIVKEYCLKLSVLGYKPIVIVYYHNNDSSNEKVLIDNSIEFFTVFKKWNLFNRVLNKLFHNIIVTVRLRKAIQKYNPIALHIHSRQLHDVKLVSKYLKNTKLVYTCHSLPERYFRGKNENEYQAGLYLIEHNSLQLVGLHDKMRQELNNMFNVDNTIVIKNGVDFCKFQNVQCTRDEIRSSLGIPQNAYVIGHIGRFMYIKNQRFIVDLFSYLTTNNVDAFLLLVGHGEDMKSIREKITQYGLDEKTLILSHRSDISEILKAMDVFLFPSLFEGLPLTLIEAQVAGVRCVCSNTINSEAFITENISVLPLDAELSKWVEAVLDRDNNGKLLATADDFSSEQVMKQLVGIYDENAYQERKLV